VSQSLRAPMDLTGEWQSDPKGHCEEYFAVAILFEIAESVPSLFLDCFVRNTRNDNRGSFSETSRSKPGMEWGLREKGFCQH